MRTVRLYSENNDFQRLDTIKRNREKRHRYGEFFVEGVRAVERLLAFGWDIRAFACSRERQLSSWAQDVLAASSAEVIYEMPQAMMDKLSDREESSELVAVARIKPSDIKSIGIHDRLLAVVFDRPVSPGNLGSLVRTCDAFRADALIVTGHAADIYDPQCIRASVGSLFTLPVLQLDSPREVEAWAVEVRASRPDLQLIGTSAHAELPIDRVDFRRPTILLVGNETDGLSRSYTAMADSLCTIPMAGSATSLNVAAAASVSLYEAVRQRGFFAVRASDTAQP
ncbi:MAG TPA: TrmH family RNA methyltransferase [Spirochaetia bacterium]|nr:TrmH family RNA methyltransferase [Spirochaetia bacterium]